MTRAAAEFFDEESEAFARRYEKDPSFRERMAIWSSLIEKYGGHGRSLLDVGCGPGYLSCAAAHLGMSVVGIDPSRRMIELADTRKQRESLADVSFREGSLESLGEMQLKADLVVCSSVLEYLADLEGSLRVLGESVLPGGHLIVSMPNAACWVRRGEAVSYAITKRPVYRGLVHHVVSPEEFASRCERLDLHVVETHFYATHHALRFLNPLLADRQRAALFVAVLRT